MISIVDLKTTMLLQFEGEIKTAKAGLNRKFNTPADVIFNAEQRMLGVANFCQSLGLDYDFIEETYNFYKEKLENLLTN